MLVLGGCLGDGPATASEPSITVSAASSLIPVFSGLGRKFQEETGVKVTFNFGASGQLARQIEEGAPVDVFASADTRYVEQLADAGMVLSDTKATYALGRLVLIARADLPFTAEEIVDLTRADVKRVAMANPDHAPYGVAAREALQAARLWDGLQPKLILAENASQALQFVETGNVDVALVSRSLVPEDDVTWSYVPKQLHTPIAQTMAVVTGTEEEDASRRFVDYVLGSVGRTMLRGAGYSFPGEGEQE
jgi:molybdate transport system substrate-binding protein